MSYLVVLSCGITWRAAHSHTVRWRNKIIYKTNNAQWNCSPPVKQCPDNPQAAGLLTGKLPLDYSARSHMEWDKSLANLGQLSWFSPLPALCISLSPLTGRMVLKLKCHWLCVTPLSSKWNIGILPTYSHHKSKIIPASRKSINSVQDILTPCNWGSVHCLREGILNAKGKNALTENHYLCPAKLNCSLKENSELEMS